MRRSNDDVELKTLPVINQNNNWCYSIVSYSKSNDEANKNLFDEDANDEVETTPRYCQCKVVQAMKKLQVSYNKDGNKIVKEAAQKML